MTWEISTDFTHAERKLSQK